MWVCGRVCGGVLCCVELTYAAALSAAGAVDLPVAVRATRFLTAARNVQAVVFFALTRKVSEERSSPHSDCSASRVLCWRHEAGRGARGLFGVQCSTVGWARLTRMCVHCSFAEC